jgi:integration host factor subunit beta
MSNSEIVKSELIARIVKKLPQWSEEDVDLGVNQILDYMGDVLSKGNRIEIRGFGSLSLRYRPPRNAHNPKTKEKLVTPPKYVLHFKAGKELRERVNNKVTAQE